MGGVLSLEHPVAAAHRGSRILWPENTMPAFQGAIDLGYRFLETDLHATADGQLVAFHDDTLDRCTDATGKVWDRSAADLAEIDAAHAFGPDDGFPFRGLGIRIPLFEEVVTAFPDACFILDLKQDGIEEKLVRSLDRHDLADRVIIGSFRDARIRKFRRLTGGAVATSSGPIETIKVRAGSWLRRPSHTEADVFQVPVRQGIRIVDAAFVAAAHAAGKHVHVWTVDDPGEMHRLLDLGVDGLITDRPDVLRDVMIERGGGPW